jgi:tetratricopeptide (TPR) repeat protein
MLTTFGRWNEVLAEPLPPPQTRVRTALAYYARGIALAAMGDFARAQTALDTVKAIDAGTAADNGSKPVTSIAMHALMGEIAARSGKFDDAVSHFRQAVAIDDSLVYNEPPRWYYPLRQSLGAALLKGNHPGEAETVYQEDLKRFPENGWSLYGLALALRAQGRIGQAAQAEERLQKAWANADVKLAGSRF